MKPESAPQIPRVACAFCSMEATCKIQVETNDWRNVCHTHYAKAFDLRLEWRMRQVTPKACQSTLCPPASKSIKGRDLCEPCARLEDSGQTVPRICRQRFETRAEIEVEETVRVG